MGKFCDFISEKGRLQGSSEIVEKNKVQREKWPVPSNGPPVDDIGLILSSCVYTVENRYVGNDQ